MTEWRLAVQRRRAEFIEGMARLGFTQAEKDLQHLIGEISPNGPDDPPHIAVDVELVEGFPYLPPKVRPFDGSGSRSWHQEANGAVCLYSQDNLQGLPWSVPETLVARIAEWFDKDHVGWPDDPPDLDLERYFERDVGLVLYDIGRVAELVGRQVRLTREKDALTISLAASPPKKSRGIGPCQYGWVIDAGELAQPFRTWTELAEIIGDQAASIEGDVRRGRGDILLVLYTRQGLPSVAALRVFQDTKREIQLRAMIAADQSQQTRLLRAGLDVELLRDKHVTLIGLGAVGSFLADLLARQGVGRLTLVDGDLVRPGNCARHLAPIAFQGRLKAEAVKDLLEKAYPGLVKVAVDHRYLQTPDEAENYLLTSDLVIDATAQLPTTTMLEDLAAAINRPLLAVYIQRDGGVLRVDRSPLRDGETRLPEMPPLPDQRRVLLREGGCGDPISPTPPSSVLAAAALACRAATDVLTGRLQLPASIAEVLGVQEKAPYDRLSLLV
jgi:molybdopterin/thiamine biosynthesis adenylyltransferase